MSACAPQQTQLPVDASSPAFTQEEQAQTHAMDGDDGIQSSENPLQGRRSDPWELVEQSHGQAPEIANPLLLNAAELFLSQQNYSTAFTMLGEIDTILLDDEQRLTFSLIQARYSLLSGDTATAVRMAGELQRPTMTRANYIRLLELNISIAAQQLNFQRVVLLRLKLDPLLMEGEQLNNQRKILSTLGRDTPLFSIAQADSLNAELPGWVALADLRYQQQFDFDTLAQWRQQYPQHPARIEELTSTPGVDSISSRNIALLLPLTSKLGRAAQAFKAGFDAAIKKQGQAVNYQIYDTGAEAALSGFYYQSAVNDGADFVIGPLGRTGTQSLVDYLDQNVTPGVSSLILGELNQQSDSIPNLWGLSLSPEQDADEIAERAISIGQRRALVISKDNAWGNRLQKAFTQAFTSRGGVIAAQQSFPPGKVDYTSEIKKLLNINSSEVRHARLQQILGLRLKFSVRRRDDVDFIFLAGNAKDARSIVPLAKFYRAHDLPIYATSSVFKGKFNKLTDEDIKDLHFADLPWLLDKQIELQAQEQEQEQTIKTDSPALTVTAELAPLEATPLLPYTSATLNRLYALGFTAFESIPQLAYLQSDDWYRFETETMSLNMDKHRNLRHRIAWGKYTNNGISVTR